MKDGGERRQKGNGKTMTGGVVKLVGGYELKVDDPLMYEYLRIKHEVFKVGEGEKLPEKLLKHPARIIVERSN